MTNLPFGCDRQVGIIGTGRCASADTCPVAARLIIHALNIEVGSHIITSLISVIVAESDPIAGVESQIAQFNSQFKESSRLIVFGVVLSEATEDLSFYRQRWFIFGQRKVLLEQEKKSLEEKNKNFEEKERKFALHRRSYTISTLGG